MPMLQVTCLNKASNLSVEKLLEEVRKRWLKIVYGRMKFDVLVPSKRFYNSPSIIETKSAQTALYGAYEYHHLVTHCGERNCLIA